MRKLAIALALTVGIVSLNLFGCARQKGERITIGVTFTSLRYPVFQFMDNAIREAASKDGVYVLSLSANGSSAQQLAGIEDMITKGVDAIIINAVNEDAIVPAVKKCNAAGIPVILLDRMSNGGEFVAYVTADSYKVGVMQAEFVAEKLGGKGKVVIMQGTLGNSVARDITRGNVDTFKKYPDIEIVVNQSADWNREKAMTLMENVLQRYPDIDAVLANNDTMIMGALKALENAGRLGDIITIGADADKDALIAVKQGKLTATVDKMPIAMALKSYEVALKTIKGESIDEIQVVNGVPTIYTPSRLITKDNVDVVTRWGKIEVSEGE